MTPLLTGTTGITYTLSTGCVTTAVVTVNALPAAITGTSSVCSGSNVTLSCATTGGTWSSGASSIASIGTGSGIVTGGTAGTVNITYTAATTCFSTYPMTVNPLPASITGYATVCVGYTTELSNATAGGTWESSNSTAAPISSTGIVSGNATGTTLVSYTLPTGCFVTRTATVNPLPAAVSGTLAGCQGATVTLTDATTGGTWSSGNASVAIVGASGTLIGGAAGTANVTYTLPTGCYVTAVFTVNPVPSGITGDGIVCTGATSALASATPGGSWTSSNTAIVTVGTSGIISGVLLGTATITYTLSTSCYAVKTVTVNASPSYISGTMSVCIGQTTNLSSASSGGAWTSSNVYIATVSGTGNIYGATAGTAIISYVLPNGCFATATTTVLPLPASISGNLNLCVGETSPFTCATTGGTWTTSNTALATIGSSTGVAYGVATGLVTISFTLSTGCFSTVSAAVNNPPGSITGSSQVCQGSVTNYLCSPASGTWVSSDASIASVGSSTGIISGMTAGTATISYVLPTGCSSTKIITVNPLPAAISGPSGICQASTVTMTDATAGGTWASSTPAVATAVSGTGAVTGVMAGNTLISYILTTGCYVTQLVSVTALPAPVSGVSTVCEGSTILLSDVTGGGTWGSGSPSVATIASTGLVTGVSAGTVNMTYMLPLGCIATKIITVNAVPAAIVGPANLCIGSPVTFTDATSGGAWSSGSPSIAVVTSGGLVTGSVVGTTYLTYTLPNTCFDTALISVNLTPSAIAGASQVCQGATIALTNTVGGGTWTSSNTAAGTIDASTGILTGIAAGTTAITYQLSTSCIAVRTITVNPVPAAISGPSGICQGQTIIATDATSGGTWTSSNPYVSSVGTSSGLLSGVSAGTTNITYALTTGCYATYNMTVYALPAPITGSSGICLGSSATLSNTTTGGTWYSTNPGVASITSGGIVSGAALGTSLISYTVGVGCTATKLITVNPQPADITGSVPACVGATISLADATAGGTWTNTTLPGIATVNATTGVVTPVSAGTATITYTLATGCYATTVVTVDAVDPILGNSSICIGAISTLSHTTTGGTWTSGSPTIAGVGLTSGTIVGYGVGTAIISYHLPGGCIATRIATVGALPAAITGTASVCPGFTTTLFNSSTGGTWSSTIPAVATIDAATGVVTGVMPGFVTISYSLPTGCAATKLVTVNSIPAAITGPSTICAGTASTLTSAVSGGTWLSSNTSAAFVGLSSGLMTGLGGGNATITYTPPSGCKALLAVTVYPAPAVIGGPVTMCTGDVSLYTNTTSGGTWSSSATTVASVGTEGLVTALTAGTTILSYTTGLGCNAIRVVTVNTAPGAITGVGSACIGYTTALACTPAGGTWTSSSSSVASVGASTGLVTGLATGTSLISYSFASGCKSTIVVTVTASPSTVAGVAEVCVGSATVLYDPAAGGGTWSSANTAIATVGSVTGTVSGIATGTVDITYTIGTGCRVVKNVTVDPVPAAITGIATACIGMGTNLNSATTGGTWSSTAPLIASVGASTGLVSGVASGTATISYSLSTGCSATYNVTINPAPAAILGTARVCVADSVTLTNAVPGGVWMSDNAGIATVGTAGVVTGVASGTTTISYMLGAGCAAHVVVTVDALPAAIVGPTQICQGGSELYTCPTTGGTWSMPTSPSAGIDAATGWVSAYTPGTVYVQYTISSGCRSVRTVTINPQVANTGLPNTCIGFTTTLSNVIAGGTWSSSAPSVATVGSLTGVVSGVAAGTTAITYLLPTGCQAVTVVTVSSVASVVGPSSVCLGNLIVLSHPASGGTWSSSAPAIANVSPTGDVSGVATGTAVISYTFGGGCVASSVVTVNPLSATTGATSVCMGQTITLSNAVTGGTWSSASPNATVDATSGVVTGVAMGTAAISYTLTTGCTAVHTVTVNELSPIIGPSSLCLGASATFTDATTGGTWSSASLPVSVDATTGVVNGLLNGSAVISYRLPSGCVATKLVTVNSLPAAIGGPTAVCQAATVTLTNTSTGGAWSSDGVNATIGAATGVVTGVTPGTSMITYTLPTGCTATTTITVNSLPSAISGTLLLCEGYTSTLINMVGGGTWTSGIPTIAGINATTGLVTANAAGTAIITYTLPTSCRATAVATVQPLPAAIAGAASVCVGSSVTASSTTMGGSWSVSNSNATIDAGTGTINGVSAGTTVVSYVLPTGCFITTVLTINALPADITGPTTVCVADSVTLADATAGGTWSSMNPAIAGVGASTGVVNGITDGVATIQYTLGTGCYRQYLLTVNALPAPISGASVLCEGASITLATSATGGSWTSGATSVAAVSSGGVVTGVAAGVVPISYVLATGCLRSVSVTVQPLPAAITGMPSVCNGQSVTLGNATSGGVWSSTVTTVATVDGVTGVVTSVSPGTTNISYTLASGCARSVILTVNLSPAAITGPSQVCAGGNITLLNTTTGGTWTVSPSAIASVTSAGIVHGSTAGTAIVSYTLPSGCRSVNTVTVNPIPPSIMGAGTMCPGDVATLTNSMSGGTWSSTSTYISLDGTTGVVTALSAGAAVVSYTLATGCYTYAVVVVNAPASPITGTAQACVGSGTTLSNSFPGGTWTSGNLGVATVGLSTGVVTAVAAGTAAISYHAITGCPAVVVYTVNPLPATIAGATNVCLGGTTLLSCSDAGGTWMSSSVATATIGSSTGMVSGVSLGAAVISYTLPTGCSIGIVVSVNPAPLPITGTTTLCEGGSTMLTSASTGGTWASTNTSVATVASGVVVAVGAGTATIVYTLLTGCSATTTFSVNALAPIVGSASICAGTAVPFTNAVGGGLWSSSTVAVATVTPTGVVTAIAAGVAMISYMLPSGCLATQVVTVQPHPAVYVVTGGGTFCSGDAGVPVGLNSSATGHSYSLYRGATLVSTLSGTGSPLSFGIYTVAGTYSVIGTATGGGCTASMSGTAIVNPVATGAAGISLVFTTPDTICNGTGVTGSAVPYLGGSTPSLQWYLNGVFVGSAATYSWTPANGDIISCRLTSSSSCASPATATAADTFTVLPVVTPAVTQSLVPGDTVCAGSSVSFGTSVSYGGSWPNIVWYKNGAIADTGATYNMTPVNGDVVYCNMMSDIRCRTADTVWSGRDTLVVLAHPVPVVTVTADPGFVFAAGTVVVFTASVTNAGVAPAYQWSLNGLPITGATNVTYTTNELVNGDSVACSVTAGDPCGGMTTIAGGRVVVTNVGVAGGLNTDTWAIYPNPNTGRFILKGYVSGMREGTIQVTDAIGRTVYTSALAVRQGGVSQQLELPANIVAGVYLLHLQSNEGEWTVRMVVEK